MLSILILVCQSAFVRTEVNPGADLAESSTDSITAGGAEDEIQMVRHSVVVPDPTIAETSEVSVDDLEPAEEHTLKCSGEPDNLVEESEDAPEGASSYVQISDAEIQAAYHGSYQVTAEGSCGRFQGSFDDHLYNASVGADKNVLYLYPSDDHNGAFNLNYNLCERLKSWYSEATSVHVYKAKSVQHAKGIVEKYAHDSIMLAVLGGHGSASSLHWGEGSSCGGSHLCSNGYSSKRFLQTLASRIPEHGSIFMDSCLTASEDRSLSWWTSQQVGKGIRVMGSPVSFSSVYWGRFGAGNYVEAVRADGKRVQVIHYKTGGYCPSFAKSRYPDSNGECECRSGATCHFDGGKCPLVRSGSGGESSRYFVPGCATIGDRSGKCTCSGR